MRIINWLVKNVVTTVDAPRSLESIAKMHIAQKKLNDATYADNKRKAELEERQRKAENYRRAEKHLRKSVENKYISNSHTYNSISKPIENPDEWGHLSIHNDMDESVGIFYCRRPTKVNSITHTFNIPGNTTVKYALFTTKAGYQFPRMDIAA